MTHLRPITWVRQASTAEDKQPFLQMRKPGLGKLGKLGKLGLRSHRESVDEWMLRAGGRKSGL